MRNLASFLIIFWGFFCFIARHLWLKAQGGKKSIQIDQLFYYLNKLFRKTVKMKNGTPTRELELEYFKRVFEHYSYNKMTETIQ